MNKILWAILHTVAQQNGSFQMIVAAVQNVVPECEEELIREQLAQLLLLGYLDITSTSELSYGMTEQGAELWKKSVGGSRG